MEHAVYSVISPEGCAAILWRSGEHRKKAAEALRLTSKDLIALRVADEVIPEPFGGAHSDWDGAADALRESLIRNVAELRSQDVDSLLQGRWAKYEAMGAWREE
jgi:acetyl-CoA carboxylase carboxyl transferase subunit alpha